MKTRSKQWKRRDLHLKVTTRATNENTLIFIVSTTMNNNNLFLDLEFCLPQDFWFFVELLV